MSGPRDWDTRCKVYVGNLSNNGNKYDIESTFSKYGPLRNVWVARNPPGFAFVEFEDPRDAEDAVRGLDGSRICGARARVEMSSNRPRRGGGGGGGGFERGGGGGGGGGGGRRRSRSFSPRRKSRSRSRSPHHRERSASRD